LRQPAEQCPPVLAAVRLPLLVHVQDLVDHLLAVAEHGHVQEGRQGLAVKGAWAAGDHQGVVLKPVPAVDRHASQVEAGEDVCIGEFVEQGKRNQVELPGGRPALESKERNAVLPHLLFHIGPGCIRPLAERVAAPVDLVVHD
jgi:hypothetical protein